MNSLIKKSITLSFVSLFLWGSIISVANADANLRSQLGHGSYKEGYSNSGGGGTWIQTIGTGLQGSVSQINLWYRRSGGSGVGTVTLVRCDTYTYYSGCSNVASGSWTALASGVDGKISINFAPVALDSTKYYAIVLDHNNGSGNTIRMYGNSADTFAEGYATSSMAGYPSAGSVTGISDFYFEIRGENWFEQLGFVGSNAPSSFEATTSPVFFDLKYYLDETVSATQYFGVLYNYDTGSSSTWGNYTLPDTTTGTFNTATQSLAILENGSYSITWWLRDPQNQYGTVGVPHETTFSINASSSFFQTPAIKGINSTIASTSCNINFLATFDLADCATYMTVPSSNVYGLYGSIPKLLASKFPFSYVASIQNTWKELSATASTTPTLSYNLHDIGIGSTTALGNFLPNIEIFSEATITTYLSDDILAIFRALIATVLISLTFLNIYGSVMRLMHKV